MKEEEFIKKDKEIDVLREDKELVDRATDILYTEKILLDYWLAVSSAVDSIEELQYEMFARYEQAEKMFKRGLDKLDKLEQKIAPYEGD